MKDEVYFGFLSDQFRHLAGACDGAVAVITPDDKGGLGTSDTQKYRTRQNVILEIGWFWGRHGLDRVAVLQKESDIQSPSDIADLKVTKYRTSPEETAPVL